jgi:hypothetical protein
MRAFLYFTISLMLLAAVAGGVATATGHVKHRCTYQPSETVYAGDPGSGYTRKTEAQKTCSWRLK